MRVMENYVPSIAELQRLAERNLANQIARARAVMGDPIQGVKITSKGAALIPNP